MVSVLDSLSEDLAAGLRTHAVAHNSNSKGSDAVFCLPAVAKHTCGAYTHPQANVFTH